MQYRPDPALTPPQAAALACLGAALRDVRKHFCAGCVNRNAPGICVIRCPHPALVAEGVRLHLEEAHRHAHGGSEADEAQS